MPAGPCTGALRRKLPTGHPSVAGPPGHKSFSGARCTGDPLVLPAACPTPRDHPAKSSGKVQGPPEHPETADSLAMIRRPLLPGAGPGGGGSPGWRRQGRLVATEPEGRGGDQDVSVGQSPPPASGGGCAEEGNRAAVEVGRQDGPAGHRPADTAGARVAAAGQESGPLAEADRGVVARRPAVDREAGPTVAAAVGWAGLPAHCTPLRRGAEERGERHMRCSAYGVHLVADRVVAEPPRAALCHRSASADVVTSIVRPDCYRLERWGGRLPRTASQCAKVDVP